MSAREVFSLMPGASEKPPPEDDDGAGAKTEEMAEEVGAEDGAAGAVGQLALLLDASDQPDRAEVVVVLGYGDDLGRLAGFGGGPG